MGLFNKGGDVIDFTYLQKRGLLKKQNKEEDREDYNEGKILDLTSQSSTMADSNSEGMGALAALANAETANSINTDFSPLGFMDNPMQQTLADNTKTDEKEHSDLGKISDEVDTIKVKLDDFEYKLERFVERIEKLESRLVEFERNSR